MHYYKRHLGDYAKKAGRLSMLQHGSYTLLIDACYDREKFPTLSDAIEWTWASSTEEVEAVTFVLKKFFSLEGDVFVQGRIKEEIEAYREKSATNTKIAIDRETKRKETKRKPGVHESSTETNKTTPSVSDTARNVHEAPPNHKPLTTNHKPLTINQETQTGGRFLEFWKAYPKKMAKPDAEKSFHKVALSIEVILADLAKRVVSDDWLKEGGRFVPYPATYLNQRRWEDGATAEPARRVI